MKRNQRVFFSIVFIMGAFLSTQLCTFGQSKKAGQESCDGALDVVPAKALTFNRKRRPTNQQPLTAQPLPAPRKKSGK